MTHTPGPWIVDHDFPTEIRMDDSNGEAVFALVAGVHVSNTEPEQALADARLIAAAPEMLAALKAALADFGDDYGGPTIDAMRAAIAKAEGRA